MEEFRDEPIAFLTVYVREPHAGEARFWRYKQPKNYDEKLANARLLIQQKKVTMPFLLDGMDELAHRSFGRLPNMIYVIDKTGRIVYKSMWTRHAELREFLEELCAVEQYDSTSQKLSSQAVGA